MNTFYVHKSNKFMKSDNNTFCHKITNVSSDVSYTNLSNKPLLEAVVNKFKSKKEDFCEKFKKNSISYLGSYHGNKRICCMFYEQRKR